MTDAMIDFGTTLVGRARSPLPRWSAQLRDALTRRQKELPVSLVDGALALLTPGATGMPFPMGSSALLADAARDLLAETTMRSVLFVDGIPDDARMFDALPPDSQRVLLVAHRVPDVARRLAAQLASWNVAATVHAVVANAAEDLGSPAPLPRPAVLVLPGNVLGMRTTVEMVRVLRVVRSVLRPGDRALIAVDLRQDAATLEATFAEPGGPWDLAHRVLVEEVGRTLDGSLTSDLLAFEARFDRANARTEGHLVARQAMAITLADGTSVPIGRRESLRTVVFARLDRKRLEGMLRGCALEIKAWEEDGTASAAVALIEPVTHT